MPLAPRLSVQPVLGYDADHERVLGVLRELAEPAEQPLFDEAVIAAGGLPEGVSTKPRVDARARHAAPTPPRPRC